MSFTPDDRQRRLIEETLRAHQQAQEHGEFAPERLVRKWSREVGIECPESPSEISDEIEQTRGRRVMRFAASFRRRVLNCIRRHHD